MRIKHIRIIACLLLAYIIYLKTWTLLPYWTAMTVSLEVLNRHKAYLRQANYTLYNWFFVGYLILVVADRTRQFHLNETFEWGFNSLMHILFGLIVCFKMSQYWVVLGRQSKHRLLYIAMSFNALGVFNEVLQNWMGHRALFVFIPDSLKDMVMNVVGTLVFLGIEYIMSLPPSVKMSDNT